MIQVFFLPLSNTILTIFKDDTIHGWETDTLEYKYQVGVIGETAQHFRSFAATQDGRLLVAGGRFVFKYVKIHTYFTIVHIQIEAIKSSELAHM